MRRFLCAVVACCAILSFSERNADATIIIPKNLSELAAEADSVFVGQVTGERVAWLDGEGSVIMTHWTMTVKDLWKGQKIETITISEIGGTIGDITCAVAGAPRYKVGERVVVFAKKDPVGQNRTYGWTQGQFGVFKDALTGDDLVRFINGLDHVVRDFFKKEDMSEAKTVEMVDFKSKVKDLIAAADKKKAEKPEGKK